MMARRGRWRKDGDTQTETRDPQPEPGDFERAFEDPGCAHVAICAGMECSAMRTWIAHGEAGVETRAPRRPNRDRWRRGATDSKRDATNEAGRPSVVVRILVILFHHLLNEWKRDEIPNWANELNLRGFSKAGHPGVVLVEGLVEDTSEFVRRLREQPWQTMELRLEERVECKHGEPAEAVRRISEDIGEFCEIGRSNDTLPAEEWCAICGLGDLWAAAMQGTAPNPDRPPHEEEIVQNGRRVWRGMSMELWTGIIPSERRAAEASHREDVPVSGGQREVMSLEVDRWQRC